MKIRARLAYAVVLEATVPDGLRAFVVNPQILADQVTKFAKPAFAATLSSLFAKLAMLGVVIRAEDAELTVQAEPPAKE